MSSNISSPFEYFSKLLLEEHSPENAEVFHKMESDTVAHNIRNVFRQFGINTSVTYDDDFKPQIKVSRASLNQWFESQRAISKTLTLDVPTFIKIVTRHQLNEAEKQQVAVALRALHAKDAIDLAKMKDLHHLEYVLLSARPTVPELFDRAVQTISRAHQERDNNLKLLSKMVSDKKTPKKDIIVQLEKGVNVNALIGNTTLLIEAARAGHVDAIEALVAHGAKLNQKTNMTALHGATLEKQTDAIKALLAYGANINQTDQFGETPLHYAASVEFGEAIAEFAANQADLNATDVYGKTPLHFAVAGGHRISAEALLSAGAKADAISEEGSTPLTLAIRERKGDIITLLIDRDSHVSPSTAALWKSIDGLKEGSTVPQLMKLKDLQQVCEFFEDIPSVKDWPHEKNELLGEMQARLREARSQRLYNTNRLFEELVKEFHNISEIKTIIEKGIDVKQKTGEGETLLTISARTGNKELTQLILDAGADVNEEVEGKTPLMRAIAQGDLQSVQLLLDVGADVNKLTKKGTALHVSAQNAISSDAGFEILELLLQKGASLTLRTEAGETVMHVAARQGNFQLIKTLVERGADFSQADSKGKTPLDIVLEGYTDENKLIIPFLIEKGYGQKLVSSMLQQKGNSENHKMLFETASTIDPKELLRDINFATMDDILLTALRDDKARNFVEKLVRASLSEQWIESNVPENVIRSRLRSQPFLIRPAEGSHFHIQSSGRQPETISFYNLTDAWIRAEGKPADMLEELNLSPREEEGAYSLEVARSAINEDPQVVLEMLCDLFHEQANKELAIQFTGESGQDVGGLGRQFVSQLFFALSRDLKFVTMDNGLLRPATRENSEGDFPPLTNAEKTTYRNIGQLMMFCLNAEVSYPVGMLFDQGVFVALAHLPPDELQKEFSSIDFSDAKNFDKMFQIYKEMNRFIEDDVKMVQRVERSLKPQNQQEWKEAEQTALLDPEFQKLDKDGKWADATARQTAIQEAVRRYVAENKLKPTLAPLFEIAKGLQQAPFGDKINFQEVQEMHPLEFSRTLQGTVSKEDILGKLRFTDIPEDIQGWFRDWIQKADQKEIEELIFALSGSSAIGEKAEIKIKEEGQFLFHTCFNTFGLKCAAIKSENDLKKNLAWALEYARAQGGFDLA